VVIIFQENRTPDNLFHDPVLISRGADIAQSGQTSSGATVPLTPVSLATNYDLSHSHQAFLKAWNDGAMNGADLINCSPTPNCPSNPQYQYVQASEAQPYFTMAETYTFGDRMFQTNQGPSFPAHQYILAGTSAIAAASTTFVADNPFNNVRSDGMGWAGCLAPPGSEVNAIDTSNPDPHSPETVITQLCYEHPTLTDLLNAANLSWTYYAPQAGSIWTAPDAIQHMCVPTGPPDATVCTGSDWSNHVVIEGANNQIVQDIAAGHLPAVSWVIPNGKASDHAGGNQGLGPSWVASIVNAIGMSPYWADTAILVTWDDWGGWYDHVPPPQIRNSYEYGLRVPLLVISPYAKPAYISHVNHDFGSILRFTENVFSLGQIDPTVGYADSRSDDLSDCFDFNQTPLVFTPIAAPVSADYFLNDKSPPTPPDDD
jgi:phospholipase C